MNVGLRHRLARTTLASLVHAGCTLPSETIGRWNDDDGRPGDDASGTADSLPAFDEGGDAEGSAEDTGPMAPSCPVRALEVVTCPLVEDDGGATWDATVEWVYGNDRATRVVPLVGPVRADGSVDVVLVVGDVDGSACRLELVRAPGDGTAVNELDVACDVAPALADIDGDCVVEIVLAVHVDEGPRLVAIEPDGGVDWVADGEPLAEQPRGAVALHDLDGDGKAEVIFAGVVHDHAGHVRWSFGDPSGGLDAPHAADLDGDGTLELVAAHGVWSHDGEQRIDLSGYGADARAVVVDGERDGDPELWIQTFAGLAITDPIDGTLLGSHGSPWQGHVGTGIVDDLDGDGFPELLGLWKQEAAGDTLAVLWWPHDSRQFAPVWTGIADYATGTPTAFDLDADGRAEAIIAGADGAVVVDGPYDVVPLPFAGAPSSGPHVAPVVADVDGDDSAEILLVSASGPALTVIGHPDGAWANARPMWNQFASSVTNVNDDGSIPTDVVANWSALDTFATNARVHEGRLCARAGPL